MKSTIKNAAIFLYFVVSISTMGTAMFYPFLLASEERPPLWCSILLGVGVVVIVATLPKVQQWIFNEKI